MKDKELEKLLKSIAIEKSGNFTKFAKEFKQSKNHLNLKIRTHFENLNLWLEPFGLEVIIKKLK